jgi:hypothetical protein
MSTITTINQNDLITNSRIDINTNFSNLNADKEEVTNKDTDTTLAANSDTKYPSQKAVKAYVDAGGNVNASETTKGIVQEATDAQVTAGTATGSTGAKLFITPAKLATRFTAVNSIFPYPDFVASGTGGHQINVNTTAIIGRLVIPFAITPSKVSFLGQGATTPGAIKVALYSEDGQTKLFEVTTASIANTSNLLVTTAVTPVAIKAGIYYIVALSISTTDCSVSCHSFASLPNLQDPTGKVISAGTLTVTASTMPATFNPASDITRAGSTADTLAIRLDV